MAPAPTFFAPIAERMPSPPADFQPPVLWGTEAHVSALLEPLGVTLRLRREVLTLRYDSPEAWMELYEENFGPILAAKAALGDRWPEARAEVIELAKSTSLAEDGTMATITSTCRRSGGPPPDRTSGCCSSRRLGHGRPRPLSR